jgi:F-type H+-transporting ATPase subunit b
MSHCFRLLVALALLAFTPLAMNASVAYAAPETAHAEGDHAHEKGGVVPTVKQAMAPALATLIVFVIVLFVLSSQVWPKVAKGLADRESKIRAEIKNAEDARKQAKEALEQYQQNLAEARAEANKMIEQARAQQQALSNELKAKADVELGAMREKAMKDIDAAKRAALAEIYTESTALATTMAGKILRRELGASDNQRLVDESLAELGRSRN